MAKLVKVGMAFKEGTTNEKILDFLKEYIDGQYIIMNRIDDCKVIDTNSGKNIEEFGLIKVAKFLTSKTNLRRLKRAFGKYLTIREGW